MPFDGVVTKCMVDELQCLLLGGRIEKVYQPESDEIHLSIRSLGKSFRLVLSANASYPRIHLTEISKENPMSPPMFCMLLRKHLTGGKITGFEFNDYERIVGMGVEAINELGDLVMKKLVIEIMGKHSNIILLNEDNKIIDAIKHIDNETSGVREVMPARPYVLPPAQDKTSPDRMDTDALIADAAQAGSISLDKYLLSKIKGFSPLLCREICHRAGIDSTQPASMLSPDEQLRLKTALCEVLEDITHARFRPCIIYEDNKRDKPVDFHCLTILQHPFVNNLDSISQVLDRFYSGRDNAERMKQKKSDLTKVVNNSIQRCNKKAAIHQETLREVADREKLKLFGELITANIHSIPSGIANISLLNYYSENNEYINIPLDENLSAQRNAQRYYRQYMKVKTAHASAQKQLEETLSELEYLENVSLELDNSNTLHEIEEVRQELADLGYFSYRKKGTAKKREKPSEPLHFKSTDGYDIFVGKNNRQNDHLTMKMASSNDLWLHTRNIPGSHVVIRKQAGDIPDRTLLEAAMLAAWHSRAKMSSNVPVDYTCIRNVKKPPGAKPGMVTYDHFKTVYVTPEEQLINALAADRKK